MMNTMGMVLSLIRVYWERDTRTQDTQRNVNYWIVINARKGQPEADEWDKEEKVINTTVLVHFMLL